MLEGISWGQFTEFMLVATSGYYVYVLGRYYRREIVARLRGRPEPKAKGAGPPGTKTGVQPGEDAGGVMFKAMEEAIGHLKAITAQAVANKMDSENMLDHVRELLGRYRQLKGTAYESAVNNFLVRTCSTNFSVALSDAEVKALWE